MGPKIESRGALRDRRRRGRAVITDAGARSPPRSTATTARWIVPDDEGPSVVAPRAVAGMSWAVRVVRNRYADSVRLMSVARGAARPRRRRGCEVGDGHAGEPRGAAPALGAEADAAPADIVIAVDADGDRPSGALAAAERELGGGGARRADGGARRRRPPPRSLGAAARRLGDAERRADLGARRVRDARGAPRADARACTSSCSPTTSSRRPTRSSSSAAAPSAGCSSWARAAARRCSAASGSASPTSCRPGPVGIVAAAGTGAQEVGVPARRRGRRRVADRRRRRPRPVGRRSAGSCSARRCACSPPTTRPRRCCSSPSRRRREVVAALGDVDVPAGKRVVAAFVGWDGGDGAVRDPRRRSRPARSRPPARPRPTSPRSRRAVDARRERPRPARCSACSPAARWPTRR